MMKRLIALILVLCLTLTGCDLVDFEGYFSMLGDFLGSINGTHFRDMEYTRPDMTALNQALLDRGLNKLALGHHYDDAVETFMMNLLFEGRIGCFQPVTNLDRTGIIQIRHRLEAADASLIDQRHNKGLHRVIIMVTQRQLSDAPIQYGLIQGATAHFGAHGAGILFLTVVKDDGRDLCVDDGIRHIQFFAEGGHAGIVHAETHIDGNGLQLKITVLSETCQQLQQHQAVLATGNANGDLITGR